MKKEKLSLKGIRKVLSRSELKEIMAGSGTPGCRTNLPCVVNPKGPSEICCIACVEVGPGIADHYCL